MNQEDKISYIIVFSILSIFLLIGIIIILSTFITNSYLRKKCTYSITTVCIKVESKRRVSRGVETRYYTNVFCPEYKFHYNGIEYFVEPKKGNNIDLPKVNEEVQIFINPDDPKLFYRPSWKQNFIKYILGISFLVGGIIALCFFIRQLI